MPDSIKVTRGSHQFCFRPDPNGDWVADYVPTGPGSWRVQNVRKPKACGLAVFHEAKALRAQLMTAGLI